MWAGVIWKRKIVFGKFRHKRAQKNDEIIHLLIGQWNVLKGVLGYNSHTDMHPGIFHGPNAGTPVQKRTRIEKRRMPKDAADSSESVDIKVLTVGGSVWEL